MSKKIWSGQAGYNTVSGGIVHIDEKPSDCTIVHDSACFPVKEARALCKIACEFSERSNSQGYLYPGYGGFWDAVDAFKKAQERMRKKVGK